MGGCIAPFDGWRRGIACEVPALDLAGEALFVFAADGAAVDGLDAALGGFVGAGARVCPFLPGSPNIDLANPPWSNGAYPRLATLSPYTQRYRS